MLKHPGPCAAEATPIIAPPAGPANMIAAVAPKMLLYKIIFLTFVQFVILGLEGDTMVSGYKGLLL